MIYTTFNLFESGDFSVNYTEEGSKLLSGQIPDKDFLIDINRCLKDSGFEKWMTNYYAEKCDTVFDNEKTVVNSLRFFNGYFGIDYYINCFLGEAVIVDISEIRDFTKTYFNFTRLMCDKYVHKEFQKEIDIYEESIENKIELLEQARNAFRKNGYDNVILFVEGSTCIFLTKEQTIVTLSEDESIKDFNIDYDYSDILRCYMSTLKLEKFNEDAELIRTMLNSFQLKKVYEPSIGSNSPYARLQHINWGNFEPAYDRNFAIETFKYGRLDTGSYSLNYVICIYGVLLQYFDEQGEVVEAYLYKSLEDLYLNYKLH